jgi:hypothetical protein
MSHAQPDHSRHLVETQLAFDIRMDQLLYPSQSRQGLLRRGMSEQDGALLRQDEAIQEADTLLLTVPNQLGVVYNVHVMESILKHVASGSWLALIFLQMIQRL